MILVTEKDKSFNGCKTWSLDEFMDVANGDGIDQDEVFYFDVGCLPDEDTYEALYDAFNDPDLPIEMHVVTFDDADVPDWFNGVISPLPDIMNDDIITEEELDVISDISALLTQEPDAPSKAPEGKCIAFGSAKGGSGKTFTSLITAHAYAKDHPKERVCVLDLDIEEPQHSIIMYTSSNCSTTKEFYPYYIEGKGTFENLARCATKVDFFCDNVDFYFAPRDAHPIEDSSFWLSIMVLLAKNYDMVIIDTGTTYMGTEAITYAYKFADKLILVSMANIASTVAVSNQIDRITGATKNNVFSEDDGIAEKMNLVVTNAANSNASKALLEIYKSKLPPIAVFPSLSDTINEIQLYKRWDLLDDQEEFMDKIREIYTV